MANVIRDTNEFIDCKSKSSTRLIEYQLNRKFDVDNNVWYSGGSDFTAKEWVKEVDISTEEAGYAGTKRGGLDVSGFNETITATLSDDTSSSFLQELFECTLHGDNYFFALLNSGLNVRTTVWINGMAVRKTYNCCTVTEINGLYEQINKADSEVPLTLHLSFEPKVENMAFSSRFPNSKGWITFTEQLISVTSSGDFTAKIKDIIDTNDIAVMPTTGSKYRVALFNKKNWEMLFDGEIEEDVELTATAIAGIEVGDEVIVAYSFCWRVENGIDYFRTMYVRNYTIKA